ncbi:cysteine dioxygenase family protein [Pendulispora rubella]|uniref:Cysteine dioxygenase family protein n=1 Tax=Pendulispora rubella TaxID=2741070 RepID=A0ABZ2L539_9BACT
MNTSHTSCAKRLIGALQDVVHATPTAAAIASGERARRVAGVLESFLSQPDLLSPAQLEADPRSYRQHLLHVEPGGAFSVVALVWLPGQQTPIHDHVSWCVVGTYRGQEEEVRYELVGAGGDAYLVPTGFAFTPTGTAAYLTPPGDIHAVRNGTDGKVVSIHIYGADVSACGGTSIRRRYDLPVRPATNWQ